jgi:hypothetical protein
MIIGNLVHFWKKQRKRKHHETENASYVTAGMLTFRVSPHVQDVFDADQHQRIYCSPIFGHISFVQRD